MTGEWIGGPNQPALPVTWKRMEGESCAPEEGKSSESDPPRTTP
jgi:hypothetical protein